MEELNRAVLVGNVSALAVAFVGSVVVFLVWRWATRRSRLLLLLGFGAILLLAAVYVGAASRIVSGAYPVSVSADTEQNYAITAYVHPGPLIKLAPALAIVLTWGLLLTVSRKFAGRANRGPTPHSS